MAKLKAIYDKAEDIPEGYGELYIERNGRMELTGIEGVKTQGDIDRVQEALRKEKNDHKVTKESLQKFGELKPDDIHTKLDELTEAQAQLAAINEKGGIDESKLEPVIEARIKRALGPVERDKAGLQRQLDDQKKATEAAALDAQNLRVTLTQGKIEQAIREAAASGKLIPTAIEDAVSAGMRAFEVSDDGRVLVKDNVGFTPGIEPKEWLKDMQERRPHWWPKSEGSGARGGQGGPTSRADNPWTAEGWNLTKQGQLVRTMGDAKAAEVAKSVGSFIGATKPAPAATK